MLTIYQGGFRSSARAEMLADLRGRFAAGAKVYLFVPEQQTLIAEREMAGLLPPSAPLRFEVTNFSRFANTVFRAAGGLAGRSVGRAERALMMWKALAELSPFLQITGGRSEIPVGAVEKMLGAVREMQSFSIGPEDLLALCDGSIEDRRLDRKLSDLAKVMELYRRLCAERFAEGGDELLLLAEKLADRPDLLDGAAVYLEGFTSLTEPQYAVLSATEVFQ